MEGTHDTARIDTTRIVSWVTQHGFQRVALQFPDSLLAGAPDLYGRLRKALPNCKVFMLGDSFFGGGGVDEVGAQHYGADCVVRFGQAGQQRGGTLPALFVFDTGASLCENLQLASSDVVAAVSEHLQISQRGCASLLLVCDLPVQQAAMPLASALKAAIAVHNTTFSNSWRVLVANPREEAEVGEGVPALWRDWRWGQLDIASGWWSRLGPLTTAAAARPSALQVCGKPVSAFPSDDDHTHGDMLTGWELPKPCAIVYVGSAGSDLERRLLLRYNGSCPVWRLQADASCVSSNLPQLEKLSSQSLLLKRYRFVEFARSAAVVGLLLVTADGNTALSQELAKRYEIMLRQAGRRCYRLVVGQPTQEKLGNFPGIECYVLLSGPDQFPWDARDLMVPICTPYELEVALGAREWTGDYLADLDELLATTPAEFASASHVGKRETTHVHSLGQDRIKTFDGQQSILQPMPSGQRTSRPPPAEIAPGLHGVPWKYSQEESL
eukprot:TRINITY_DN106379_c0_g1_i1.p1 TRINITY_DN106379_c0_g1~~TRINITY_DN106379_c0_g1_i1.p1  ORF type:complete len:497 (-),score=75.92 TRINITY_DN106379_c0_g1_i1:92-1582(-)